MITRLLTAVFVAFAFTIGTAWADQDPTNSHDDWDGWYLGAFGGHAWGELTSADNSHFATTGQFEDDGYMAGVYVMRRWQMPSDIIFGVEFVLPLYMDKGTAVDNTFFPGLVTYESDPQFAALVGAHVGQVYDDLALYLFGDAGFARVEGHTYNVDNNDLYSPGFVQTSENTHFIWQLGGGAEFALTQNVFVGGRAGIFMVEKADHTMPWNVPGPNEFGYDSLFAELRLAWRFGGNNN